MPTRAERLADYFLKCAGIAGVYAEDKSGVIQFGFTEAVSIACPDGRAYLCCAHAVNAVHIARRAYEWTRPATNLPAALALMNVIASEEGIELTAHAIVVDRAMKAVRQVNATFMDWQDQGLMKPINREFKALRRQGGVTTYADFLHMKKAEMLRMMATG